MRSHFGRLATRQLVADARSAIRDWEVVRNTPAAQFFLLALLKDLARFAD